MIVVLRPDLQPGQLESLQSILARKGLETKLIQGTERQVLAVIGHTPKDTREIEQLPGVSQVIKVGRPYKLAAREAGMETQTSRVMVGSWEIGGPQLVVMAGPCSVESRQGLLDIASKVKGAGAHILRGGAYKPRSSPYAFQGMGQEGLEILAEARKLYGLPIVTEVVSPAHVDQVAAYTDLFQIGARNMQNFELLKAVAATDKPVLLKRGLSATIEEFLMSAEYVLAGGNGVRVILCERGIRTFEPSTRNTLDLSSIPVIRALSHLPIIVDPSHGTGHRNYVASMALAAVAGGADGLMIEVHPNPPEALSDGAQSLYPHQFEKVMRDVAAIAPVVGRHLGVEFRRPPAPITVARQGQSRAAYQGEPGAYSERALRKFFGASVEAVPCHSFAETFSQVASGATQYAVLPMENSLAGSVQPNYELILEHPELQVVGEISLRICHSLIVHPGTRLEDIKRIYAHPQAAAQCEDFLRAHPDWEIFHVYDTAGSVHYIQKNGLRDAGAIAARQVAEQLQLEVLQEGIESHPRNYTRFWMLERGGQAVAGGDKASIIFDTPDHPGALHQALGKLTEQQINLHRLESRPIPGKPWEYRFFADLQVPEEPQALEKALESLRVFCPFYRLLGIYRAAD
ncbi:MAG: 3-deoxy-7-phosphoheptulonate synthase [Candidatus Eremiobacteraeota bacterium]|nr:3-deoxy-7-phosphoheptulonate synthase [Candidatus Eremiobacteraeota bacterium]